MMPVHHPRSSTHVRLALGACAANSNVPAGPMKVGSAEVTLGRDWSDISTIMTGSVKKVRVLSIDGPLLNRLYVRDAAVGGNIARFINHSCTPNCYTIVKDQTIWIVAARNIRKGEELTYDYSTDGPGHIRCRCSPGCDVML